MFFHRLGFVFNTVQLFYERADASCRLNNGYARVRAQSYVSELSRHVYVLRYAYGYACACLDTSAYF